MNPWVQWTDWELTQMKWYRETQVWAEWAMNTQPSAGCIVISQSAKALAPSRAAVFSPSARRLLIKLCEVQCFKAPGERWDRARRACSLNHDVHQISCKLWQVLECDIWWCKVYGDHHRSLNVRDCLLRADIFIPESRRCTGMIHCSCFLSLSRRSSV